MFNLGPPSDYRTPSSHGAPTRTTLRPGRKATQARHGPLTTPFDIYFDAVISVKCFYSNLCTTEPYRRFDGTGGQSKGRGQL